MAKLDEKGREILDSKPVAMPAGYHRPPSLADQVRRLVRSEHLRRAAEEQGFETFEDAEDFDVGDDYDPKSPFELEFDPILNKEVLPAEKAALDASRKAFDKEVKAAKKKKKFEQEVPTPRSKKTPPDAKLQEESDD